jgi:tetratricopeptide (TPR) repeat protein
MENELRPILCTAMSPRRCKRLTGVKLALPKRDPFRRPPSFGSLLSAELERAAAAVSAFQLKWIPSQMAARLYTHRHQANGHWRGQSVGSSVIPKTLTDFAFQYLSTGVAPFYKNLLSTPFRTALSVDPLDADTRIELGATLYRAGRFAEAEAEIRRVLEISPSYAGAHYFLGGALLARGQAQAALLEMQHEDVYGGQQSGLATVYYALGRKAESDSALRSAERDVATEGPYLIALTHAFRGEADAAFRWLDRAYIEKSYQVQYIKGEWLFSSLQNDTRYKAFLKKMNLPE